MEIIVLGLLPHPFKCQLESVKNQKAYTFNLVNYLDFVTIKCSIFSVLSDMGFVANEVWSQCEFCNLLNCHHFSFTVIIFFSVLSQFFVVLEFDLT